MRLLAALVLALTFTLAPVAMAGTNSKRPDPGRVALGGSGKGSGGVYTLRSPSDTGG